MKVEYNNLYTHFVLTTYLRHASIKSEHRNRIEKYITGIVNHNNCQLYAIYANPEHVHILISRSPNIPEEEIVTRIANSSAKFINDNNLANGKFEWQQSCSAFSVSKGEVDNVCKYILNQYEHHRKKTYQEEVEYFLHHYQRTIKPK